MKFDLRFIPAASPSNPNLKDSGSEDLCIGNKDKD